MFDILATHACTCAHQCVFSCSDNAKWCKNDVTYHRQNNFAL